MLYLFVKARSSPVLLEADLTHLTLRNGLFWMSN